MIIETVKPYQLLKQGFQEEMNWNLSSHSLPLSQAMCPNIDNFLGLEFLCRFQSPTMFLKISCDGDFLLPIVVGVYAIAIEKLMDSLQEDDNWDCPNLFQFARNLVTQLGYQASIYVNKQVILTDAIRISYRAGQVHGAKPCYDVQLDRCLVDLIKINTVLESREGPNLLAEELDVVENLHLAVRHERYLDAAMLRDKLIKLQKSS